MPATVLKLEPAAPDPAATGRRVLAALDAGRRRALELQRERCAVLEQDVRRRFDSDLLAGNKPRGRPGRIARQLHGAVTARGVAKILERLFRRSDLPLQTPGCRTTGDR